MGAEKAQVLDHVGLMAIVRTLIFIVNEMMIHCRIGAEKSFYLT